MRAGRKNDEPEIISGVAERGRPNADVPSPYEKLMTSRSRRFPSSPGRFYFPRSGEFIPSSISFFPFPSSSSFRTLFPLPRAARPLARPAPVPFYLSPVSLYCQPSFDDLACLDEI